MDLSIVRPFFNDEEVISELFQRLYTSLEKINLSIEIVLVDDGSFDNTIKIIENESYRLSNYNLKLIKLMRNFGQMAAITAGTSNAKGKYTVLMDSDLQDRPEHIELLYKKIIEKELPMINSYRRKRKDSTLQVIGSKIFHLLSTKLKDLKFPRDVGVFRIFETKYFIQMLNTQDNTTTILSLMDWTGVKYETIELDRDKRFSGKSGYSFSKMISLALDRVFSFSTTPIRFATYAGIILGVTAFFISLLLVIQKLFFLKTVAGWVSTVVIMLISTALNLIFLGVIGEYLSRIYQETKKRPKYLIEEVKYPNRKSLNNNVKKEAS